MRSTKIAAGLLLALPGAALLRGQEILHHWDGEGDTGLFGFSIASMEDIDGDGVRDLLVGALLYPYTNRPGPGKVYLYSGKTGATIATLVGQNQGDGFGIRMCGVSDLDGDRVSEFLVGANNADFTDTDAGRAYLYSGATQALLRTFDGEQRYNDFGTAVAAVGDVNADGVPDFAIGANSWTLSSPDYLKGRVYVFSGADGAKLLQFQGEEEYDSLGTAIAGVGDVNGDSDDDLFVTAPSGGPSNNGRIYLFSGRDGRELWRVTGPENAGGMGISAARVGDLDGDGVNEVAAGGVGLASGDGGVFVYSGKDGAVVYSWTGPRGNTWFGFALAGAGDVNGDQFPDIVVGAPYDSSNGPFCGRVYLYSGRDGSLLHRFTGKDDREFLGWSLAGAGDLNGDGFGDVLVGATNHDEVPGVEIGGAWVFAGNDLFLEAEVRIPADDRRVVKLFTRGGPAGASATLFMRGPAGGPRPVGRGTLDGTGKWIHNLEVPRSLWGATLTFQTIAMKPGPGLHSPSWIDTSPAQVTVPP